MKGSTTIRVLFAIVLIGIVTLLLLNATSKSSRDFTGTIKSLDTCEDGVKTAATGVGGICVQNKCPVVESKDYFDNQIANSVSDTCPSINIIKHFDPNKEKINAQSKVFNKCCVVNKCDDVGRKSSIEKDIQFDDAFDKNLCVGNARDCNKKTKEVTKAGKTFDGCCCIF